MTRDEFIALAGVVYDAIVSGGTASASSGAAPKYDTSIARKGGMVQWASESDLGSLIFWKGLSDQPPTDIKYAESNKRQSRYLAGWIAYRQAHPDEVWTGERNKVQVTALPPCDRPATYPREARQASAASAAPDTSYTDDSDIPF